MKFQSDKFGILYAHGIWMHFTVSTTPAMHNLTDVVDTGDACIAGVVDTGKVMSHWCRWYRSIINQKFSPTSPVSLLPVMHASPLPMTWIAGVVGTGDASLESLTVRQWPYRNNQ
jgi:hypothetical protein